MPEYIKKMVREFKAKRERRRRAYAAFTALALAVSIGTGYALARPAATLEGSLSCGLEEHTHTEACYTRELVCGLEEGAPEGHVHTADCYEQQQVLTCGQDESDGHTHGDSCYDEEGNLICGEEEGEGHTHTGACYTTEEVLVCGEEEGGEGHVHTDACYEEVLTCGKPEHTHTEACYVGTVVEESPAPEETEAPAESALPEETGAPAEEIPAQGVCILPEHTHDETCYDADGNLICTLEEHTHGDGNCVLESAEEEIPLAPLPEIIPEGYTDHRSYVDEENGFTVVVYAQPGQLPEGVAPVAELYAGDSEAYAQAGAELDEQGVERDGYAAMDIHLEDADGDEYEPADTVYVDIQAQGLIPADADPATVAVQHHVEASSGLLSAAISLFSAADDRAVTVETVADAAGDTDTGLVEVQDTDLTATFEVESFSTFTITWWSYSGGSFSATVHYVDTEGNEIDGSHGNDVQYSGTWVTLADYASNIDTYTYVGARVSMGDNFGNAVEAAQVRYDSGSSYYPYRQSGFYYRNSDADGNGTRLTQYGNSSLHIYLVYEADSTGVVVDRDITNRKYVDYNEDRGTYDLNLTVSGALGTAENKAKLDILLIVDRSNSMDYVMDSDSEAGRWDTSRKDAIDAAVELLTDAISENAENIDARYSVIQFSGPNRTNTSGTAGDADVVLRWTTGNTVSNGTNAQTAVEDIDISGATNYQAAIRLAKSQITASGSRSDAQKIVIFFTDGIPTVRIGGGNGLNDTGGNNINAAINEIKDLSCTSFYAIGAGPDFGTDWWGNPDEGLQNLQNLCKGVNADTAGYYSATSTTELNQVFSNIAAESIAVLCTDVHIRDTLNENVAMVYTDGESPNLTVRVERTDGTVVAQRAASVTLQATENNSAVTLTPRYDSTAKQITLDFPADYSLEPDYVYIVTAEIEATEKAYENYRENGGYPDTGDNDTGTTSAGQKGLYSNVVEGENTAFVTYDFNGENDREKEYPKPVIQLEDESLGGDLALTKIIGGSGGSANGISTFSVADGSDADDNPGQLFQFKISFPDPDPDPEVTNTQEYDLGYGFERGDRLPSVTFTDGKMADDEYIELYAGETVTVEGLPAGVQMTITEITTDGYSVSWSGDIAVGTSTSNGVTALPIGDKEATGVDGAVHVTCTNTTGARLPSTGGSGTLPYMIFGAILTAGAGILLLAQHRRKEESDAG